MWNWCVNFCVLLLVTEVFSLLQWKKWLSTLLMLTDHLMKVKPSMKYSWKRLLQGPQSWSSSAHSFTNLHDNKTEILHKYQWKMDKNWFAHWYNPVRFRPIILHLNFCDKINVKVSKRENRRIQNHVAIQRATLSSMTFFWFWINFVAEIAM